CRRPSKESWLLQDHDENANAALTQAPSKASRRFQDLDGRINAPSRRQSPKASESLKCFDPKKSGISIEIAEPAKASKRPQDFDYDTPAEVDLRIFDTQS